jgi:hypothetical protein
LAQQEKRKRAEEHSETPQSKAEDSTLAEAAAEPEVQWTEAIHHLNVMLSSDMKAVRLRAATALGVLAESDSEAKEGIVLVPEIIVKLVELMNSGSLEAISAICVLTTDHAGACDQVRNTGAISTLAGYINTEADVVRDDESDNSSDGPLDAEEKRKPGKAGGARSKQKGRQQQRTQHSQGDSHHQQHGGGAGPGASEEGAASLSDLRGAILPGMTANLKSAPKEARPVIVPVGSKAEVVSTLRNIATSNDRNREAITQEKVIPNLVKLMTKMQDGDDNRSSNSGLSRDSQERLAAKRDAPMDVLDRKTLAQDNRRLAESAGQMLHTLILQGSGATKRVIISAIIKTVQQPGSVPPEEVPALMTILRSAAEEQLALVQTGSDESALRSALEFGRWIKVPTIMLGEARNVFKASQEARKKEALQRQRRLSLGLAPEAGHEQEAEEWQNQKKSQRQHKGSGDATSGTTSQRGGKKKSHARRSRRGGVPQDGKEDGKEDKQEVAMKMRLAREKMAAETRKKVEEIALKAKHAQEEYANALQEAHRKRAMRMPGSRAEMRVRFMIREAIEGGEASRQGGSPRSGSPRSTEPFEDVPNNRVDADLHFEMQRAYHDRMHQMQRLATSVDPPHERAHEPPLSPEHSARRNATLEIQHSLPAHRGTNPSLAQLGRTSPTA